MIVLHLLAFVSGFADEGLSVFWVHHAAKGNAFSSGLYSGLQAIARVVGIGESIHDWRYGPAYVLGYGLGSSVAVLWLKRFGSPT
jgi:hypothetical protein